MNEFQTLKSKVQIGDYIDVSTYSIKMCFKFIPLFYLNQFEEFEHERLVEEVAHVHKECKFDDDHLCLGELFRDDMVVHASSFEHIDQNYEDECDDDGFLFQNNLRMNLINFVKKIC